MIRNKNVDPLHFNGAWSTVSIPTAQGNSAAQVLRIPYDGFIVSAHHCQGEPLAEPRTFELRRDKTVVATYAVPETTEEDGVYEIEAARGVPVEEGQVLKGVIVTPSGRAGGGGPQNVSSITLVIRPKLGREK